jgi:hypothetical protein
MLNMKGKLIVIAIVSIMIVGSFGAVGTHLENNEKVDCGCNDSKENVGLTDAELADLQAQIDEKGYSFTVGRNSVTDYDIEDLCGLVEPEGWQDDAEFDPCISAAGTPSSFDWRSPGGHQGANWDCTTPIKNQKCGDCWAFGTVAPLESKILINEHLSEDLSEQWLKSCNTGGYSCNGGWWAHQWHAGTKGKCGGTGAVEEDEGPPYSGSTGTCGGPYLHKYLITKWAYIGGEHSVPSTSAIKNAIYNYGPVSAAVYVDSAFQGYTGGVFKGTAGGRVNHAVVLVGWNDDGNYWILRNSWGTGWGESGYMRIKYGSQQIGYASCYIDGYKSQFSGEETVTLELTQVTNKGDSYEPIDINIIGQPDPPEWFYEVEMGTDFKAKIENLNPGQGGEDNIWPYDNFKSEYTWDIDADTEGHLIQTESREVPIKIKFYDWDALSDYDQADISKKSSRAFIGTYDVASNQLEYSDGEVLEASSGIYTIKGPKTDDWKCDNARVKFKISDSFDKSDYSPELWVENELDFGTKSSHGSSTGKFSVKNNADFHEWADKLKITSVTIEDGTDWLSSAAIADDELLGQESSDVTVRTKSINSNGYYEGTIKVSSNDGSKNVHVELTMEASRARFKFSFIDSLLESQFSMLLRMLLNIPSLRV